MPDDYSIIKKICLHDGHKVSIFCIQANSAKRANTMNLKKCYEILGIKPGSSYEEIKETVRDMIKVWHPDRFGNDSRLQKKAQEKLKEINEAYETLKLHFPKLLETGTSNSQADNKFDPDRFFGLKRKSKKLSDQEIEKARKTIQMMMRGSKK